MLVWTRVLGSARSTHRTGLRFGAGGPLAQHRHEPDRTERPRREGTVISLGVEHQVLTPLGGADGNAQTAAQASLTEQTLQKKADELRQVTAELAAARSQAAQNTQTAAQAASCFSRGFDFPPSQL